MEPILRPTLTSIVLCLLIWVPAQAEERAEHRSWIGQMKESSRGPFSRIRWFCNDGAVLPPKAYACSNHGGGVQHGQWSERTRILRSQGYYIATLLAGLDGPSWREQEQFDQRYAQLLIEKFLISVDDGWILRQALFYRGAIQEEDERSGARRLLLQLLSEPAWLVPHYGALRTGLRLLPHGEDSASISRVRQWSAALSERDKGFHALRVKIHGSPDAGDAARVRAYLNANPQTALTPRYEALASEIDAIYQGRPLASSLSDWGQRTDIPRALAQMFGAAAKDWQHDGDPMMRLSASGRLLLAQRDALVTLDSPALRLELMDLGLRIENEHFSAAAELRPRLQAMTRRQWVEVMLATLDGAYGTGALNRRLHEAAAQALLLLSGNGVTLIQYKGALDYLARVPGWGVQGLRRYFYEGMLKLGEIEPRATLFIQDQLRVSPLLFFSQTLDHALRDAGQLAGIRHSLFGEAIGVGFNALNPGLARGVLHVQPDLLSPTDIRSDGIYLLPETLSELPPVAGILTAGEGNPLSHVQLLARNLGIPNVSVAPVLLKSLAQHEGESVVLAVSPGGLVSLEDDGPAWDEVFGLQQGSEQVRIAADLDKLDLSVTEFLPLHALRADDSGRSVGPKAAKLGELHEHYPNAVSRGLAIPFGLFKQVVLDQVYAGEQSLFDWMSEQYTELALLPEGDPNTRKRTEAFRSELYSLILQTPLPPDFIASLRKALRDTFGEQPVGLFVRSDTNVEDLAGFTGAGLNLTLPNVVGFDALLEAISRVWASPFSERAYAWRQSHMSAPEHVYTSILLQESVGSDKSGVMVTANIDTGSRSQLSVAVNEGLGGAVDGQAAESLRIDLDSGAVRVMATATAPYRTLPNPEGGVERLPTSGNDWVLKPEEIEVLIEFVQGLPERYPSILDDEGNPTPADIEFGFTAGKLRLFQLRPFLQSRAAGSSGFLRSMDKGGSVTVDSPVDMNALAFQ